MADEAFALSPISARAAQPSEADYEAIREAFMETSRGRWFLGEYAKRNRNADTTMVLDAVARIEETLAAQKAPPSEPRLAEALAGIRAALAEARTVAAAALGDLALEENLAPVRKGARVIREIAWRLREIGADSRICDLIDSQLGAIDAACGKMATIDPATELNDAFGLVEGRIASFDDSDAPAEQPAEEASASAPPAEDVGHSAQRAEEAEIEQAVSSESGTAENAAQPPPDPGDKSEKADDAYDEALLEMVALEMAAPHPDQAHNPAENEAREVEAVDLPQAVQVSPQPSAAPSPESSVEAAPEPAPEPSLGSSLIASGIVPRPRTPRPDPLAPIRRLSQSEKIALFS